MSNYAQTSDKLHIKPLDLWLLYFYFQSWRWSSIIYSLFILLYGRLYTGTRRR